MKKNLMIIRYNTPKFYIIEHICSNIIFKNLHIVANSATFALH